MSSSSSSSSSIHSEVIGTKLCSKKSRYVCSSGISSILIFLPEQDETGIQQRIIQWLEMAPSFLLGSGHFAALTWGNWHTDLFGF